ncbi:hypothetical protein ARALYDRAFT_346172 [Arabidopsis lyrata subsp. lyrata]|uniref:Uncharacterized protein n=1 Tax=Arabidopsis lyrata subsp. lyrata TaxID=81972 RepID=D7LKG1_ARALL|nr:hypothetical protein ARALYDRAFT_346172 [Arabidopsis lyrata subsp. lyrata]
MEKDQSEIEVCSGLGSDSIQEMKREGSLAHQGCGYDEQSMRMEQIKKRSVEQENSSDLNETGLRVMTGRYTKLSNTAPALPVNLVGMMIAFSHVSEKILNLDKEVPRRQLDDYKLALSELEKFGFDVRHLSPLLDKALDEQANVLVEQEEKDC